MQWIHNFCEPSSPEIDQGNQSVLDDVHELMKATLDYTELFAQLSLLRRGRNRAKFVGESKVEISAACEVDVEAEAARLAVRSAQDPEYSEEALGVRCIPDIQFRYDNKSGNVDLLVIDEKSRFALVTEMKWLTSTDDVKGTESDDRQILKGVQRAKHAVNWISNSIQNAAQKLKLPVSVLKGFEFRPLVLTKESLISGFIDVPVINDSLLNWILFEPHHRGLRDLWKVAKARSYLPKLGVHFKNLSPSIHWDGIEFVLDNIASQPLERWSPANDISFS